MDELKKHVLDCYPNEACGIVENGIYIPQVNIADGPAHNFRMSGHVMINHNVEAIIHSHIVNNEPCWFDQRTPTKSDMVSQIATNLPWGIVCTDAVDVTDLLWFGLKERPPYEGREFIHSVQDCMQLMLDWYKGELNIDLPICPRDVDWFMKEPLIDKNIIPWGFRKLDYNEEPQYGDVILFRVRSEFINHMGIFIEPDKQLHHLINRLSYYDQITSWERQIVGYARHKKMENRK